MADNDIDYEKTHVLRPDVNVDPVSMDIESTLSSEKTPNPESTLNPETTLDVSPLMVSTPLADMEHTLRPTGNMQMAAVVAGGGNAHTFNLKGVDYYEKVCLSNNTGEAQVFLVEREGVEYVLKVYYANFDINKKLMPVVRSLDFELVVKVYDYGRTYVDGVSRFYELMEYLRGGTMKDLKINGDFNRFRRLALQAAGALAYCHQNRLLHKDVKPTNFFFRDQAQQQLVLGDFGISAFQEDDNGLFRTPQARTPVYAAPEMYSDVIDGIVEITYAADYYSLGITLFAFWLGENPMSSNERTMMRQKNEGRLPRLVELPEQVKKLIQGLTSVNPQYRWGYNEVERWFKGEDVEVDNSSPFLRYKSFVVDPETNLIAEDVHELVPMLLEHQSLAINYLYDGSIIKWLDSCGSNKLSSLVKDIVTNRYPADQKAGLLSACYAMEPSLPYKDVHGMECDDEHAVALSLLSYPEKYALLLQNPNDSLFLWIEQHLKCDVDRLRSYFGENKDTRVGVLRAVYEIDHDVPFLSRYPSSSVSEIVHTYGHYALTDDDWNALCDGRLLSWMYAHEEMIACESLRIMTDGQVPSRSLGYKVLYNVDRTAAYDLCDAITPEAVGEFLAKDLMAHQHTPASELPEVMKDYIDQNGRFFYYAQLHGWTDVEKLAIQCFDLNSEENRERLGAYDLRTALYRFTAILGTCPAYCLDDGTVLTNGRDLEPDMEQLRCIKDEIHNGSFVQWLAAFYHEDPARDFSEPYSYEQELEAWILAIGKLDPQQTYYKRYMKACEDAKARLADVKRDWKSATLREHLCKMIFLGMSVVWVIMVLVMGLDDRTYLFDHPFLAMILPLGGMTGLIVAVRSYFKGYGSFVSILFGVMGLLSAYVPYYLLKCVEQNKPSLFHFVVVGISVIYVVIALLTDFSRDKAADPTFINNILNNKDMRSTLLDPLYYTFKTKSQRYKASNYGLLDEVADQVHSLSGELVIHYILWILTVVVLIVDLCLLRP